MAVRELKKDILAVGAIDFNRKLFDELIPLPHGTSYNSYIVKGSDKTVLIDSSEPAMFSEYEANLTASGVKKIDYIVSNHAEQDHSGSLPMIVKMFPGIKIVTNAKCKPMLMDLMPELKDDDFKVIADRETLSLGNKTLEFIIAPWVHWPETMFTYLREDKVLFSCDYFGTHFATNDLFAVESDVLHESAKRYYAEIMMPFRVNVASHLEKLKAYQIDYIAPSHGPVFNKTKFIMDAYADWSSDKVKNEVVIPFVSMHGSTRVMVEHLTKKLEGFGIKVYPLEISKTDTGEIANALVDAATVVIGMPTVLGGPHPLGAYVTFLANALKPKTKFACFIGSYGWGGRTLEILKGMSANLKVELLEPVIIKGYPKEADLVLLDVLANSIAEKHKTI